MLFSLPFSLQVNPRARVQSDNTQTSSKKADDDDSSGSHTSIVAGVVVKSSEVQQP